MAASGLDSFLGTQRPQHLNNTFQRSPRNLSLAPPRFRFAGPLTQR